MISYQLNFPFGVNIARILLVVERIEESASSGLER
jgi:hypothetical protein